MERLLEVSRWVSIFEWTFLALAAINVWRTRRSAPSRWLAAAFVMLATLVVVAPFLPMRDGVPEMTVLTRAVVAGIALFPYLLYRFLTSMIEHRRWEWAAAHALTAATLVTTATVSTLPAPGEPRSIGQQVLYVSFVAQWSFLLGRITWRLWREASTQPSVARIRMRMMAAGAITFAAVLVASAVARTGTEPKAFDVAIDLTALLAGPFFLFGFAPPRLLRVQWQQREEIALRTTELSLVKAVSRREAADAWLPRVAALVGGMGTAIFDMDRSVLAAHNVSAADLERMKDELPTDVPRYVPIERGSSRVLAMHNGWVFVSVGALAPFFGVDEMQMLSASTVVADLALGRAKLFELERQSRDAMRDFVAIASHDLRTPVTVIRGFTQLMQMQWDEITDEKKKEFLAAIERQITHLDRLIGDLLTTSKLDVEEVDVFRQPVDVATVADEVVETVANGSPVVVSKHGDATALADAEHVARMIQNYMTNAMIYGAQPYSVDIGRDNGWVLVRVCDAGPGVPEDFVPRLFGKFARADRKKSKAVQGTGLGLSIVRGLARSNGGDAWYEPNTPQGSCFVLRLPAVDPSSA